MPYDSPPVHESVHEWAAYSYVIFVWDPAMADPRCRHRQWLPAAVAVAVDNVASVVAATGRPYSHRTHSDCPDCYRRRSVCGTVAAAAYSAAVDCEYYVVGMIDGHIDRGCFGADAAIMNAKPSVSSFGSCSIEMFDGAPFVVFVATSLASTNYCNYCCSEASTVESVYRYGCFCDGLALHICHCLRCRHLDCSMWDVPLQRIGPPRHRFPDRPAPYMPAGFLFRTQFFALVLPRP